MARLPKLRWLELFERDVTDDSIKYLTQLANLKSICLQWSGVSQIGARELEKRMPSCRIDVSVNDRAYLLREREKFWIWEE